MKFFLASCVALVLIIICIYGFAKIQSKNTPSVSLVTLPTIVPTVKPNIQYNPKTFAFVPYWMVSKTTPVPGINHIFFALDTTLLQTSSTKDQFNYFYKQYSNPYIAFSITSKTQAQNFLTSLLDQQNTIQGIQQVLKDYPDVQGVVVNIELLPSILQPLQTEHNMFVKNICDALKELDKKCYTVIYGDTIQKNRPYDVDFLAKNSHGIMIMLYDLYRTNTEPGPSFPLYKNAAYNYSIQEFIQDTKSIPKENIIPIYGTYGYTWNIDNNGLPITKGKAITMHQYNKLCAQELCTTYNNTTTEHVTRYKKGEDTHEIWIDTNETLASKIAFMKEQGIYNAAVFALGYGPLDVILQR